VEQNSQEELIALLFRTGPRCQRGQRALRLLSFRIDSLVGESPPCEPEGDRSSRSIGDAMPLGRSLRCAAAVLLAMSLSANLAHSEGGPEEGEWSLVF